MVLELKCHYDHKVPLFLFTALNLMSQFNLENATLYSQSKGDADTDEVTEVYSWFMAINLAVPCLY